MSKFTESVAKEATLAWWESTGHPLKVTLSKTNNNP
jgi:hypothetical protein